MKTTWPLLRWSTRRSRPLARVISIYSTLPSRGGNAMVSLSCSTSLASSMMRIKWPRPWAVSYTLDTLVARWVITDICEFFFRYLWCPRNFWIRESCYLWLRGFGEGVVAHISVTSSFLSMTSSVSHDKTNVPKSRVQYFETRRKSLVSRAQYFRPCVRTSQPHTLSNIAVASCYLLSAAIYHVRYSSWIAPCTTPLSVLEF